VISGTNVAVSLYETEPGSETTDLVVTVSRIIGSIGGRGTVSFATEPADPLVINPEQGIVSGTVVATGATGSATIKVTTPNAFAMDVNGTALVDGTSLDCGEVNYEDYFYVP
jgi:hypothetical protein